MVISEGAQSTASTRSGGLPVGEHLSLKGLTVVVGARYPHAPVGFAILVRVTMPYDVDIAAIVGGH